MPTLFTPKLHKKVTNLRRVLLTITTISWTGATILLFTPLFPYFLYRLRPQTSTNLSTTLGTTVLADNIKNTPTKTATLPPLDQNLPARNELAIKSIGVKGQIHEGEYEEALKLGLWREPRFGTPELTLPTIIAAHRWGYINWSSSFRTTNSFLNLPKTKLGDTIEIVWNQRHYIYEIYAESTGETITDFSADLILYTCQLWDSPIRVFRYAKRKN